MTTTNKGAQDLQDLAAAFLAADPIHNSTNKKGARTKDQRRWAEENSLTGRSKSCRYVDPSLPHLLATYRRISDLQANSLTYERQEQDMNRAAEMHGLSLGTAVLNFAEEGSASKTFHRAQFEALLKTLDGYEGANPIDLIVSDLDRIARDADVANEAIRIFRKANVRLIIAKMPHLDINDDNMKQVISTFITIAEWEAKNISYRTTGGHEVRAKKGQYRGTVPAVGLTTTTVLHEQYGTIPVYTPKAEPREDYPDNMSEVELIKAVFDKYQAGVSLTNITRWLNGQRVVDGVSEVRAEWRFPTQRGALGWSDQGVRNILRNPHYNGQYIYRGKAIVNPDGSVRKTHEAIIDDVTWENVQILLSANKHRKKPRRDSYKLSGLLVCGHCDTRLCGKKSTSRGPYMYHCGASRIDAGRCSANLISGPGIESFVYDILLEYVTSNPTRLAELSKVVLEVEPDPGRQEELKSEIDELVALRDAVTGSNRVATAQRDSFDASIAAAREELATLVSKKHQHKMMTQAAFSGAKDFLELWNSNDRTALIMALKSVISRIEILPNTGKKMNQWDLKRLGWKVNLNRVRIVWRNGEVLDGPALAIAAEASDAR